MFEPDEAEYLQRRTGDDRREFRRASGVQIGKNTAISGVTAEEDYAGGVLASGETLIKAGERV